MAFETITVPNVFANSSKIRGRVEILSNPDKPDSCTHILEAIIDFSAVWVVGVFNVVPVAMPTYLVTLCVLSMSHVCPSVLRLWPCIASALA